MFNVYTRTKLFSERLHNIVHNVIPSKPFADCLWQNWCSILRIHISNGNFKVCSERSWLVTIRLRFGLDISRLGFLLFLRRFKQNQSSFQLSVQSCWAGMMNRSTIAYAGTGHRCLKYLVNVIATSRSLKRMMNFDEKSWAHHFVNRN